MSDVGLANKRCWALINHKFRNLANLDLVMDYISLTESNLRFWLVLVRHLESTLRSHQPFSPPYLGPHVGPPAAVSPPPMPWSRRAVLRTVRVESSKCSTNESPAPICPGQSCGGPPVPLRSNADRHQMRGSRKSLCDALVLEGRGWSKILEPCIAPSDLHLFLSLSLSLFASIYFLLLPLPFPSWATRLVCSACLQPILRENCPRPFLNRLAWRFPNRIALEPSSKMAFGFGRKNGEAVHISLVDSSVFAMA